MKDAVESTDPVASAILDFALLEQRVLVAVSGGADSMALLCLLWNAGRDIAVGHVNHGLRGAASDADAKFVAAHCQHLGIPCSIARPELSPTANEAAAREARYSSLLKMAEEAQCQLIATGHTADDQLETVLINWIRGSAVTGLAGMRPQRAMESGITLVRPLLSVTRAETRAICREAGWEWREDATNEDRRFLRNRVRLELVPLLQELRSDTGKQLVQQTAQTCEILQRDLDLLDEVAQTALGNVRLKEQPDLLVLNGLKFQEQHEALQRRMLRLAATRLDERAYSLSFQAIEGVRRHIICNQKRRVWQWTQRLRIEWTGPMAGNRIRLWLVT